MPTLLWSLQFWRLCFPYLGATILIEFMYPNLQSTLVKRKSQYNCKISMSTHQVLLHICSMSPCLQSSFDSSICLVFTFFYIVIVAFCASWKTLREGTRASSWSTWPFFSEIHRILSAQPANDHSLIQKCPASPN